MKAVLSNTNTSRPFGMPATPDGPRSAEIDPQPTLSKRRKAEIGALDGTGSRQGLPAKRPALAKRHGPDGRSVDSSADDLQPALLLEEEGKFYGRYARPSLGMAAGGLRAWYEAGPMEVLPDGRGIPHLALLDIRVALTTWSAPAKALVERTIATQIVALTYDTKSRRGLQDFDVAPVILHGTALGRALVPDLSKSKKQKVRLAGGSASAKAAEDALAAFPLEAKEHLAAALYALRQQTASKTGSPLEPMSDRDVIVRLLLTCLEQQIARALSERCPKQSQLPRIPQVTQHLIAYLRGFFGMSVSASGFKECYGLIGALVPAKEQQRGRKFITSLVDQICEMSVRLPLGDDDLSFAEGESGSSS